jgi:hypothetical protein
MGEGIVASDEKEELSENDIGEAVSEVVEGD